MLLLVGIAFIALGLRSLFAPRTRPARRSAVWLTLATCALAMALYVTLSILAVPQTVVGQTAPGVYLVPGPGALVMLAGIGAALAACVQAWRTAHD